MSRPLGGRRSVAALLLVALVACDYVSSNPGGNAPSSTTHLFVSSPSPTAGVLDDRFGLITSDGHTTATVRSETSDVAITSFMPQGRSWTSLSNTVSPDGRQIAYWAPVSKGAMLHVRSVATGTDRVVFTTAAEMSGNTFTWSSDGSGLAVAIDNDCQETCAAQGGTPKQELWTIDVVTGATEKIGTGFYWLPVAWNRSKALIAAGLTGPGGYLVGYDLINVGQKPYMFHTTSFQPGVSGRLVASSDARFILLSANGTAATLSWWPADIPQQRAEIRTFDGASAAWRPGTTEIWWSNATGLVGIEVGSGTQTSIRGSFGAVVGFRVDGSTVMTAQPSLYALLAVDVKTGQGATLPVGGPFVRVR